MNSTVGCSLDILMAAPLSLIYALIIGMAFGHVKFSDLMHSAIDSMKQVVLVFLILQLAYAVASCFMETGVAASIINMALSLGITAKLVAMTSLIVTAILSVATGTSWGTFAACAPIFLWLNHIVGGSTILTISAIAGGSCFGDNIGLISDTTVVSSSLQDVQITDRVRHQGVWSLLCLIAGAAAFYFAAVNMGLPDTIANPSEAITHIPQSVWDALNEKRPAAVTLLNQVRAGVPSYMIIPLILVLVLAGIGVNTLVCLSTGIAGSLVCGYFAGTVTSLSKFLEMVQASFSSAGNWVIVMILWITAFGGVMKRMDAFGGIAALVMKYVHNVRQLMFANGIMCLIGNAALANDFAEIVTMSPIMHNYLAWIAVLSMLLLTLTGLDRFIPMFSIPREPEVEFIKH